MAFVVCVNCIHSFDSEDVILRYYMTSVCVNVMMNARVLKNEHECELLKL